MSQLTPSAAGTTGPSAVHEVPDALISPAIRLLNAVAVIVPFLSFIAAAVLLWGHSFGGPQLALLMGMYILTGLGITIGFHRLFTHKAFDTYRPVKVLLGILGSMSIEGPLIWWAAQHRRHHQHADRPDDPHSPHLHGHGLRGLLAGWWHAHVGWIFKPDAPGLGRYVVDLLQDPATRWVSRLFPLWAALGLLIPAVAGGLLSWSWNGALLGFVWGGLVRVFMVHHLTWSINSVCHLWGTRPFDSHDHSRNNLIFGIFSLGEGWHNNHHAFPTSARHGLKWWQLDLSWLIIRGMEILGLAWKVRLPAPEALAAKRRMAGAGD